MYQFVYLVVFFEYCYVVFGVGELLCGGQFSRVGVYYGDFFVGFDFGGCRFNLVFLLVVFDNGEFDGFDVYWVFVDVQCVGGFVWGGVDMFGEFGEVVGGVQYVECCFLVVFEYQVVEVGDDVVDWVVVVIEWNFVVYIVCCLQVG